MLTNHSRQVQSILLLTGGAVFVEQCTEGADALQTAILTHDRTSISLLLDG